MIVTGIGYNGISSRDSTGELLLLMYSSLQQLAFPEGYSDSSVWELCMLFVLSGNRPSLQHGLIDLHTGIHEMERTSEG